MIKKYNQFVDEKVNEEYSPEPQRSPLPSTPNREIETVPGTPSPSTRPRPSRPSVVPGKRPSEEDAPLAYFDEEEDEEQDIYSSNLNKLASALGLDKSDIVDNKIEYKGKTIIFPSETSKFHVDKRKFSNVRDVVNYLNNDEKAKAKAKVDPEFEAKSYRFSRKDRLK